jgi:hypothetical protein
LAKLRAWFLSPVQRELAYLRRADPDLYLRSRKPIRGLRQRDIPLFEHYLHDKAKALGRTHVYFSHASPTKMPKAVRAQVAPHLQPQQLVSEIGRGSQYVTDRASTAATQGSPSSTRRTAHAADPRT